MDSTQIISKLVNWAVMSAQVKKIKVIQENGNIFSYFPPLNLYFYALPSSCKSTMAKEIAHKMGVVPITDVTAPSLSGTIDGDNKKAVKSIAWDCRNNVMVLDEFQFSEVTGEKVRKTLLDLTEGGQLSRGLGIAVKEGVNETDGDLYFRVKEGTGKIEMKTRNSTIIFTMVPPANGKYEDALLSRFIPYQYALTESNVDSILKGNSLLKLKRKGVEKQDVTISKKDYMLICAYVKERASSVGSKRLRYVQDCCKLFAILGKHSEEDYNLIISLRLLNGMLQNSL